MIFLTLIGILLCPVFTLACVLVEYDHPVLAFFAFMASILSPDKN